MKGQPPKPDRLKALQGFPGKRGKKEVEGEEKPEEPGQTRESFFFSEAWSPPDWLADEAKKIWLTTLPVVLRETKLQESSLVVFGMYCDAVYRMQKYSRLIEQEQAVYKTDSGYFRKRPEVELRDRAVNDVRNLAVELNLTPKSWTSSMGTFAGRQLDLFMNGGTKAPAPGAGNGQEGDDLDRFLGARPTIQ